MQKYVMMAKSTNNFLKLIILITFVIENYCKKA